MSRMRCTKKRVFNSRHNAERYEQTDRQTDRQTYIQTLPALRSRLREPPSFVIRAPPVQLRWSAPLINYHVGAFPFEFFEIADLLSSLLERRLDAIPAVVSIVLVSLSFLCLPPPYCEVLPDVESIPRVQCQNSIIKIII